MGDLKLSTDLADRYKAFKDSKEFSEDIPDSKTAYWQQHASLISTDIDKTTVTVRGVSGVYIPPAPGMSVSPKTALLRLASQRTCFSSKGNIFL